MRDRLLSSGPAGLADYEILEMLLFLGIPRRDTKPLAKGLMNRFGSLRRVIEAPHPDLRAAHLTPEVTGIFDIVAESARRMAFPEVRSRPLINSMASLTDYLDVEVRLQSPPHSVALLLNSRNQLLAEVPCATEMEADRVAQAIVRQLVHVHATAILLATFKPTARPEPSERDCEIAANLVRLAQVLSVTVHDHLVFGEREMLSLKRIGLL